MIKNFKVKQKLIIKRNNILNIVEKSKKKKCLYFMKADHFRLFSCCNKNFNMAFNTILLLFFIATITFSLADDISLQKDPINCSGKHGDFMPASTNCKDFYACIKGQFRYERCHAKHFFDKETNQCQVIDKQQCSDELVTYSSLCFGRQDGSKHAVANDCRKYLLCNKQQPSIELCRNAWLFDSIVGDCRQNDGTCHIENGERIGVCYLKHGQLTHDVNNCRGYFACINEKEIPKMCAANQYFNTTVNMCQNDIQQRCNDGEGLSILSVENNMM